jgi:CheY-like chemotaxis protein
VPKILIAEDNPGTTDMLTTLLEMEGFQVATTHHAQQVIPLVEKEIPDVLLIDFHLGQESGLKVVADIRGTPGIANIPIIVVSGMECGWEAREAGANAFLLKPFGINMLLEAVQEVLA